MAKESRTDSTLGGKTVASPLSGSRGECGSVTVEAVGGACTASKGGGANSLVPAVDMVSVSSPVLPFKGERVIIDKRELWEENSAWLEVKLSLQDGLSPWVKGPATELENV